MEPSQTAPTTLRPLGLGELLDRAVTLCVRHFWLLAAIYLGYSVLSELFGYLGGNQRAALIAALSQALSHGASGGASGASAMDDVYKALLAHPLPPWWLAAVLLQAVLLYPLVNAALAAAASALYLGRTPTIGDAFAIALRRWPQLLLMNLVYLIAFGLVYLAVVVLVGLTAGAVYVAVAAAHVVGIVFAVILTLAFLLALIAFFMVCALGYQLSFYTCVLEGDNFWDSFRVGLRRVFAGAGLRRTILVGLAYWAIMFGITIVSGISQSVVVGLLHSAALSSLAAIVVEVAAGAFGAVFITLFYYDLRVREEGLDLQFAAATLPAEAAPGS